MDDGSCDLVGVCTAKGGCARGGGGDVNGGGVNGGGGEVVCEAAI